MVVDNVVFFDGHCHMCNRSVNWLLKRDKKHALKFAPLQGDTASKVLPKEIKEIDSIIFVSKNKHYIKSTAVIRISSKLPWPSKLLCAIWIVPYPIRDWCYDYMAKRRIKWYGERESCRVPSEAEKLHFLP